MKRPHPYVDFERSPVWQVIDRAISDLVANGDLTETTARPYIVGYICKQLADSRVLREDSGADDDRPT